jgi:hypothetical protein
VNITELAVPASICALFAAFVPAIRSPCTSALAGTTKKLQAKRDARRQRRTAKIAAGKASGRGPGRP